MNGLGISDLKSIDDPKRNPKLSAPHVDALSIELQALLVKMVIDKT